MTALLLSLPRPSFTEDDYPTTFLGGRSAERRALLECMNAAVEAGFLIASDIDWLLRVMQMPALGESTFHDIGTFEEAAMELFGNLEVFWLSFLENIEMRTINPASVPSTHQFFYCFFVHVLTQRNLCLEPVDDLLASFNAMKKGLISRAIFDNSLSETKRKIDHIL